VRRRLWPRLVLVRRVLASAIKRSPRPGSEPGQTSVPRHRW
jgi:hypothetical protein